jgi:hypothetical protein
MATARTPDASFEGGGRPFSGRGLGASGCLEAGHRTTNAAPRQGAQKRPVTRLFRRLRSGLRLTIPAALCARASAPKPTAKRRPRQGRKAASNGD